MRHTPGSCYAYRPVREDFAAGAGFSPGLLPFCWPDQAGDQSAGSPALQRSQILARASPSSNRRGRKRAINAGDSLVVPCRVRAEEPIAEAAIHVAGQRLAAGTVVIVLRVIGPAVLPQELAGRRASQIACRTENACCRPDKSGAAAADRYLGSRRGPATAPIAAVPAIPSAVTARNADVTGISQNCHPGGYSS